MDRVRGNPHAPLAARRGLLEPQKTRAVGLQPSRSSSPCPRHVTALRGESAMVAASTQPSASLVDSQPIAQGAVEVDEVPLNASNDDQGRESPHDKDSEDEEEEEEEVVAVGSVAHVVQRAFRSFFASAPTNQVSINDSPLTEADGLSSEPVPEAPAAAATDSTDEEVVEAVESTAATSPANDADSDSLPPDPAQFSSNPFVQLGSERKCAIKAELREERRSANQLLKFLEERQADAKRADEAVEEQLRRQGLVIKEQIPLGPSPLRLDEHEVASPEFGTFSTHLLHAKSIVADYHKRRLERSGNAPEKPRQRTPGVPTEVGASGNERALGYLDSTHSTEIRTDATLKIHERRIAGVKTFHATSSASSGGVKPSGGDQSDASTHDTTSSGSPTKREDSQPRPRKPTEPNTMPATETRANMAILHRMQTKLDFLRNPRYAEGGGSSSSNDRSDEPHSFSVDPRPPIMFTEYDIGGVYEQTLFVRNRTSLSRRMRVLPPATLFFSVAEVVFPDPSGLIAPGMHVLLRLRFSPDSRADYRDSLTIQYESAPAGGGNSSYRELVVPLAAHREPPELSIPLVLRAKNTLVGDKSRTEIPCTNTGGAGTFWLMTERDWTRFETEAAFRSAGGAGIAKSDLHSASNTPAAALAAAELTAHGGSINSSESLRSGPFRLSPTRMELSKGDSTTLVLDYTPNSVGEQRERIVMVCDNCLVRVFQLVGRGCQVEIAVTGANSTRIDRSIATMGALDSIFFPPDVLVDSSARQTVTVANETPIDVKYSWRIAPAADSRAGTTPSFAHDPPFRVVPASGVFPQSSSLEFSLEFSPSRPRHEFCFTATLVVEDVPVCSLPGPKQISLIAAAVELNRQCEAEDGCDSQRKRCEPAVEALAIGLSGGSTLGVFAIEPIVWDFTAQDGRSALLQKDRVHVAHVTLRNESAAPVRFQWKPDAWRLRCKSSPPPFTLAVSPNEGTLAPLSCQSVTVEFTPHCVGPFSVLIPCVIPSSRHSGQVSQVEDSDGDQVFERSLLLTGDVACAQVRVLSPEVDFGLVLAGGSAEAMIEIINESSSASADWKFVHLIDIAEPEYSQMALPLSVAKDSVASRQSVATSMGNDTARSGGSSLMSARDSSSTATVAFAPEVGCLGPGERFIVRAKCLAGALPERFRATLACQIASERVFPPEFVNGAAVSAMGCMSSSIPALRGIACRSTSLRAPATGSALVQAPPTTVSVSARAEIQSPNIFLSTIKMPLGSTYLGVSVHRTLELINISNLEASFKFVEPEAAGGVRPYSLELTPRSGMIHSKERLAIGVTYTARQAGRFSALVACNVRGLPAPLGFELTSIHKGLVLSYELVDSPSSSLPAFDFPLKGSASTDSVASTADGMSSSSSALVVPTIPKLAFGDDVPLGERRTLHLLVRNLSGIDAVIDLEAKKFPVAIAMDDEDNASNSLGSSPGTTSPTSRKAPSRASKDSKKRSSTVHNGSVASSRIASTRSTSSKSTLLSNSHEHAHRLQSKNGCAYTQKCARDQEDRRVLSHGRGIAFRPEPSTVRIPPWGHAVVRVVCFSNKPGTYVDEVVSRAAGLPPVLLPATVTVTGAPLVLDRNCVGLIFPKQVARDNTVAPKQTKAKTKKRVMPSPSTPDYPTLRFGQVCVRSQAAVTRSLRVMNRSPQPARVTWRLTPPGHENHLVALSLRVDFGARIQLQITPCADRNRRKRSRQTDDEEDDDSPFTVSPPFAVVAPFGIAAFRVTLRPSSEMTLHRLMLVADAKWLEDKTSGSVNAEHLDGERQLGEDDNNGEGDSEAPIKDQRSESPRALTSPDASAARTAAGKAIAAVRMANTLMRKQPSWRAHGLGAVGDAKNVTKSCVRVLLAADIIEPELFLDQSKHESETKEPGMASYHVTFTTWSTVVGSSASSFASAAMHAFHRRELQLVNHFQAPLTFRLECVGPFVVFRAESLAPKHPLSLADLPPAHRRAQGESFMFSLPPEMAVRLELRFDPSLLTASLPIGQSLGLASRQLQSLVEGELLVRFANHSVQTIRLGARVLQPMLLVSPATHSFGHVHLTQRRVVTLRVANPTVVPATFAVEHVPLPKPLSRAQKHEFSQHHAQFTDEPGVFRFSVSSGVVAGPTLSLQSAGGLLPGGTNGGPGVQPQVSLEVFFQPRDTGKHYRSRFRLAVAHGHAFEVELQGVGHLDEHDVDDQERPLARAAALEHSHRIFTRL